MIKTNLVWLGCSLLLVATFGCGKATEVQPVTKATGTVTFVFDFGDGTPQTVEVEDISSGQTVLDGLERIDAPNIVVSGSGQNAFVTSIGDKDTVGSEGWSYKVNDKWADRSVGVYEIEPGDVVTWSYGGFESQDNNE